MPNREHGPGQLLLIQLTQEITLVLARIHALKYAVHGAAVIGLKLILAAIVSGCDHIGPQLEGCVQECVELYLTVAQDIRIGGPTLLILREHVIHHAAAVLITKVNKMERNAYLLGNHLGHQTVLLPLAVSVQRALGVMPVLHEHGKNVTALLLEQQGRYAGVNASR